MIGALKEWLRPRLGDRGIQLVRSMGRFRWVAKLHAVRAYGGRFRDRPLMLTRYVLFDPEYDNFTYELDNAEELIAS